MTAKPQATIAEWQTRARDLDDERCLSLHVYALETEKVLHAHLKGFMTTKISIKCKIR